MTADAAPTTAGLGRALRDSLDDLRSDVAALIDALCEALEHDRPLDRDDVGFLRDPIAHRGRRGDDLGDIAQGLRILQGVIYERVGELGPDPRAALAVGARLLELIDVATVVAGEAWTEAREDGARPGDREELLDAVPPAGGIVSLPSLGALDWMTLRADTTTWELVPAGVRDFLEQDARDGGTLLTTFRGYVASDLNVKLAAKRLHLHTNTARYRLGRIAERTGLDLRSFEDVATLYVAARLFDAHK